MAKALKRFPIQASLSVWKQNRKQIQTVLLTREETHHLKNVLRLKQGNLCLLFDREGNESVSRFERLLANGQAEATLIEPRVRPSGVSFELTVAQALPQDRKMDELVRKAAELAIFELIPMVTEHTVTRIAVDRFHKVYERWMRIAEQTMKQSRITYMPRIRSLSTFEEITSELSRYDQSFLLHPSPKAKSIRDVFTNSHALRSSSARILLMIGPEGGFSPRELKRAQSFGTQMIHMGMGILKTDTAFVAAASFFRLMWS